MVIVIALQFECAKDALDLETDPSLRLLTRLGLVGGVNSVSRRLQEQSDQRIGGFEKSGAHQHFQLLDGHPIGLLSLEARHQLLDFLVLGQEDLGGEVFFLKPVANSARVC